MYFVRLTYIYLFFLTICTSHVSTQSFERNNEEIPGIFDPEKLLTLNFVDTDIQDALRLLAKQHNINIITNEKIRGTITVQFSRVTIKDALDAILKVNLYDYVMLNNILIIKPTRTVMQGELISKIFDLDYVNANDIRAPVENILTPKGNVEVFTRSSLLTVPEGAAGGEGTSDIIIVSDIPENMENIERLIQELDVTIPQVMIAVKFIEISLSENENLGIDWSIKATLTGGPALAQETGLVTPAGGVGGGGGISGLGLARLKDLNMAILSLSEFEIVLEMLRSSGKSKLLSEPRITTLDNQWANMSVETEITVIVPTVATGGAGGGAVAGETAQKFTITISLSVLPRVHNNGQITLAVVPTVEAITGFSGPKLDQPIISRRTATTHVRVKNGDTIAIGGLIKEDIKKVEKRVPFFGKIPLLGRLLFTSTSNQIERSDLLIFITPHIVYTEPL